MHARRILVTLLALQGCSAEESLLPPIVWSGDHLDYAPMPDAAPLCAGTLPYMDRYVELAAAVMGVEAERTLYVHGDEARPCDDVAGCVRDGDVVYSSMAPHEHELVHVARSYEGNGSMPFFEEGAAEAFGGDNRRGFGSAPTDVLEGLELGQGYAALPAAWYPLAGHFSAYLHEQHGLDVTRVLLRETSRSTSPEEAAQTLERATGMTVDQLLDDYAEQPECTEPAEYRYPLYPCDATETLRPRCAGERAQPIVVSLDCAHENVLGPRAGEVFGYVSFDVPRDGNYLVSATIKGVAEGAEATYAIKACRMGCGTLVASHPVADRSHEPSRLVWMRAGRYALRVSALATAQESSAVTITIAGDDCS